MNWQEVKYEYMDHCGDAYYSGHTRHPYFFGALSMIQFYVGLPFTLARCAIFGHSYECEVGEDSGYEHVWCRRCGYTACDGYHN